MGYAVALLAAYPKWQQWIIDEVDEILPQDKPISELEYIEVWPKITRMLALLVRPLLPFLSLTNQTQFETMRLFPPLVHIARRSESATTQKPTTSLPNALSIYTPSAYTTTLQYGVKMSWSSVQIAGFSLLPSHPRSHASSLLPRANTFHGPLDHVSAQA